MKTKVAGWRIKVSNTGVSDSNRRRRKHSASSAIEKPRRSAPEPTAAASAAAPSARSAPRTDEVASATPKATVGSAARSAQPSGSGRAKHQQTPAKSERTSAATQSVLKASVVR